MKRLVFWRTDDGREYVTIVTSPEHYEEVMKADVVGDIDLGGIDCDFVLWPTDRPLSADF